MKQEGEGSKSALIESDFFVCDATPRQLVGGGRWVGERVDREGRGAVAGRSGVWLARYAANLF